MGAQETLDPLWMDRQPAWRTDTPCLEAALDGQTVAMLGGSHGQAPCLVDRQALCLEDRLTAWGHSLFQS